ncbi:hypothetical protein OF829_03500 [Sphingomonas sp. LB-2]|uniref:hypothetical protein n=1 Tax=Sphingomonas caeni TaxID=2984949 RepID=UPI0022320B95|nr:hypothetical protein [Sphingomonas caeni]MCW3846291.1 hypothetical protein [Sphingomonas caeni]
MRVRDFPLRWIAANAFGIAAFLTSASRFWIEPEVADIPGASGGAAFGWIVFAAPIAALFILANLGWLGVRLWRRQGWCSAAIAVLLLAAWAGTWLFDNAHHGI